MVYIIVIGMHSLNLVQSLRVPTESKEINVITIEHTEINGTHQVKWRRD